VSVCHTTEHPPSFTTRGRDAERRAVRLRQLRLVNSSSNNNGDDNDDDDDDDDNDDDDDDGGGVVVVVVVSIQRTPAIGRATLIQPV